MKPTISLALMLLLACASRGGRQTSVTQPSTSAPAATVSGEFGALAGRWTGSANVIVQWAKQKDLPVDLVIEPDGRASGTVGDAKLVDARLRTQRFGSPLRVHGRLEGSLIDAEGVRRDEVDILLSRADDGTLTGGLHSSGSKLGGKESMKLSASGMTLRRVNGRDHQPSPASARLAQ